MFLVCLGGFLGRFIGLNEASPLSYPAIKACSHLSQTSIGGLLGSFFHPLHKLFTYSLSPIAKHLHKYKILHIQCHQ